mmetsp:Transcript_26483/g.37963  ORF Transcript_26483/g.37963 Transcript_26483/m.37963 type:complete len:107 (-) Transcript_26483:869-1189(-)
MTMLLVAQLAQFFISQFSFPVKIKTAITINNEGHFAPPYFGAFCRDDTCQTTLSHATELRVRSSWEKATFVEHSSKSKPSFDDSGFFAKHQCQLSGGLLVPIFEGS